MNNSNPSAFDLSNFRISQEDFGQELVEEVLAAVPVCKPPRDQFISVYPEYQENLAILEKDRESYIVAPPITKLLRNEPTLSIRKLVLAVTRDNTPFIWPLKMNCNNPWNASAMRASEQAKSRWIRIFSDPKAGRYTVLEARDRSPKPVWPKETFQEILEIAFKDKMITEWDHPVLKELRGE